MYQSPTDMGVNRASAGIVSDRINRSFYQEIIRRYFRCSGICDGAGGKGDRQDHGNHEQGGVKGRKVVKPARQAAEDARKSWGMQGYTAERHRVAGWTIITGKTHPFCRRLPV